MKELLELVDYHKKSHQDTINKLDKIATFVERHSEKLALFKPTICGNFIDFDNPSRNDCLAVIRAFPGKWFKEKNSVNETKLNYIIQYEDVTLRLWGAPPPGSCRVIEEVVEVPAQPARREVRRRLECTPEAREIVDTTAEALEVNTQPALIE